MTKLKEFNFQKSSYTKALNFPIHLDLEINSLCNYKCVMCPQSLPKGSRGFKQGKMNKTDALKIIEYCAKHGTKTIKLFWRGEPTVNKDLADILRFSRLCGLKTMLNTNGSFPLKNQVEIANNLDWISFSLDSYHANNDLDNNILDNVLLFKKFRVITEVQSANPTEKIKKFCADNDITFKPDSLTKRTPSGEYGFIDLDNRERTNCKFPFWRMIISWQLCVKPCCVSWNDGVLDMGTLKNDSGELELERIKWIWKGRAYKELRQDQKTLKFRQKVCQKCVSSSGYKL